MAAREELVLKLFLAIGAHILAHQHKEDPAECSLSAAIIGEHATGCFGCHCILGQLAGLFRPQPPYDSSDQCHRLWRTLAQLLRNLVLFGHYPPIRANSILFSILHAIWAGRGGFIFPGSFKSLLHQF
jgi:hypothetical protein